MRDWKMWAAFVAMALSTATLFAIIVNLWIPLVIDAWNELDVPPIEIRIIQEKGPER